MNVTNATIGGKDSLAILRKLNNLSDRKKQALQQTPRNGAQKSALKVMQREEDIAKKSRLQSLLMQQFLGKYGTKQSQSEINVFIKDAIERFIQSARDLADCERNIAHLEEEIRAGVSVIKSGVRERKQEEIESTRAKEARSRDRNTRNLDQEKMKAAEVDPNQWAVLNTLISLSDEERQRQERDLEIRKRLKHKEELDRQQQFHQQRIVEQQREKENSLKVIQK
jgi:hypothetical protein